MRMVMRGEMCRRVRDGITSSLTSHDGISHHDELMMKKKPQEFWTKVPIYGSKRLSVNRNYVESSENSSSLCRKRALFEHYVNFRCRFATRAALFHSLLRFDEKRREREREANIWQSDQLLQF